VFEMIATHKHNFAEYCQFSLLVTNKVCKSQGLVFFPPDHATN